MGKDNRLTAIRCRDRLLDSPIGADQEVATQLGCSFIDNSISLSVVLIVPSLDALDRQAACLLVRPVSFIRASDVVCLPLYAVTCRRTTTQNVWSINGAYTDSEVSFVVVSSSSLQSPEIFTRPLPKPMLVQLVPGLCNQNQSVIFMTCKMTYRSVGPAIVIVQVDDRVSVECCDRLCACGAQARDGADACDKCVSRARWSRRKQRRAERDSQ